MNNIIRKPVCVLCSQTLSKSVDNVLTDYDKLDEEYVNLKEGYIYSHLTPIELISEFKSYLPRKVLPNKEYSEYLIKECSNWTEDNLDVIED